jgi:hypothetical protein
MSSKNLNPSLLDQHQMQNLMFDESHHAQRVVIVGGLDPHMMGPRVSSQDQLNGISPATPQFHTVTQKEYITVPQIERIEVPVIVKEIEIREIQVPVVQEKVQIVHVDKIVTIHDTKIVEIEKPHIVRQIEYRDNVNKDLMKIVYGLAAIQGLSILVQIVFHFLK